MTLTLSPDDFKNFYDALHKWYIAKLEYVCKNVFGNASAYDLMGGGHRTMADGVRRWSEAYDKENPMPRWQDLV